MEDYPPRRQFSTVVEGKVSCYVLYDECTNLSLVGSFPNHIELACKQALKDFELRCEPDQMWTVWPGWGC